MTKSFCYLFLGLMTCCGQINKKVESADSVKTTSQTEIILDVKDSASNKSKNEEEDCVFNHNYKELTTEWLTELKIKDFIWRADLKQALIPRGKDTVFLSKGGCAHFGISVELKLINDNHLMEDSVFWVNKAFDLAKEYGMEHYQQMIKEGKIKLAQSGETTVWFEIEDKKEVDNLEYNGVEITKNGQNKRISLSQYYN